MAADVTREEPIYIAPLVLTTSSSSAAAGPLAAILLIVLRTETPHRLRPWHPAAQKDGDINSNKIVANKIECSCVFVNAQGVPLSAYRPLASKGGSASDR
jgi:hypothetical protein